MVKKGEKKWLGPFVKVLVVVAIMILLLIPLFMIKGLVEERRGLKTSAAEQIIEEVGGELKLVGPLLVLPYEYEETKRSGEEEEILRRQDEIHVIPETLTLRGRLEVEYRSLGIYRAPVFRAFIDGNGKFRTQVGDLYPSYAVPLPEENHFIVGIEHMEGIRGISDLQWGDRQIRFLADAGNLAVGNGVNAAVGKIEASDGIDAVDFSFDMEISGGSRANFVPLGRDTVFELSGDWPSPSFLENLLPSELDRSDEGFSASWKIPEVSRPIQPSWKSSEVETAIGSRIHSLGVKLLEPVENYKKIERSNKYGLLFLMIPFAVFFLLETLARLRVHPMQYMMVGAANVVFYLLLLAISEHLGFDAAYLIAAAAVVSLISIYAYSITRAGYSELEEGRPLLSARAAYLSMPVILSAAYFWLWLTLSSEDYALLIGSAGVFAILGLIMLATRKVKWYHSFGSRVGPDGRK